MPFGGEDGTYRPCTYDECIHHFIFITIGNSHHSPLLFLTYRVQHFYLPQYHVTADPLPADDDDTNLE